MSDITQITSALHLMPSKEKSQEASDTNFLLVVWAAFFGTEETNTESAELPAAMLEQTQNVEVGVNNLSAGFNLEGIPVSLQNSTQYNSQISVVMINNARVQATQQLLNNLGGIAGQTASMEETYSSTAVQNGAQFQQEGNSFASEANSLVTTISQAWVGAA